MTGRRLIVGLFLIGFFSGIASASVGDRPGSVLGPGYHLGAKYFLNYAPDFKNIIVSPFHWKTRDALLFGGTTALIGVLYAYDGDIGNWVMDHRSFTSNGTTRFLSHFAEPPAMFGLMTAMYASGEIFDKPGLRRTALLSLEAYILHTSTSSVIKFFAGRLRYSEGQGPHALRPFEIRFVKTSFPSGHSGSIFAVATVIAGESGSWPVGVLAYGVAGLTALSRLHDNEHWASDILAGSALGFFFGTMVRHFNPRGGAAGAPNLAVGLGPASLSVSFRF